MSAAHSICKNLLLRFAILAPLLFMVLFPLSSQIAVEGTPASRKLIMDEEIPWYRLPAVSHRYITEADTGLRKKPLRFAVPVDVDISPVNDGTWTELADGSRIWRTGIYSPGAYSLNITIEGYLTVPGAKLFVYDPGMELVRGAFTGTGIPEGATMAVMPVPGDRVVVEYNLPAGVKEFPAWRITRVGHDYRNVFSLLERKDGSFKRSKPCNLDVNCLPGDDWQVEKRAVVRLLINGSELCTGILLSNTAGSNTPYLYTAQHCVENEDDAANLLAVFGYESPWCNGTDGMVSLSLSGSVLRASSVTQDFSLVELNSIPPKNYRSWYAGWDAGGITPSATVSIHHPTGDVKKIATDEDPPLTATYPPDNVTYDANAFWKVSRWELGTTEAGSSGAPLFDMNGRAIGNLTGGEAYCGRPLNDYFAKFSRNWDSYSSNNQQLKHWLDPGNTGLTASDGMDPWKGEPLKALFAWNASRVCEGSAVVFSDLSYGEIISWSWDFGSGASPAGAAGRGPHLVKYASAGSKPVRLIVETATDKDTLDQVLELVFDSPPTAGFSYEENIRKVQFTDLSQNATSWYWDFGDFKISSEQNPLHQYQYEDDFLVIQRVASQSCLDTLTQLVVVTSVAGPDAEPDEMVRLYPQPANEYGYLSWNRPLTETWSLQLVNMQGKTIRTWSLEEGIREYRLNLSGIPSGMYLLLGNGENRNFKLKLIVQ